MDVDVFVLLILVDFDVVFECVGFVDVVWYVE